MDQPTREEIEGIGLNSHSDINEAYSRGLISQQLYYIGMLLWDIREMMGKKRVTPLKREG